MFVASFNFVNYQRFCCILCNIKRSLSLRYWIIPLQWTKACLGYLICKNTLMLGKLLQFVVKQFQQEPLDETANFFPYADSLFFNTGVKTFDWFWLMHVDSRFVILLIQIHDYCLYMYIILTKYILSFGTVIIWISEVCDSTQSSEWSCIF